MKACARSARGRPLEQVRHKRGRSARVWPGAGRHHLAALIRERSGHDPR